MNLRDVINSGYKVFSRMSPDKKKAHILAIQYIELLATQTNTRMEPWDLLAVFGTGKGNELQTDKNLINTLFLAKVEEIKTKTPAAALALESRIMVEIDRLTRDHANKEVVELERKVTKLISDSNEYFSRGQRLLVDARAITMKIEQIQRKESTVPQQISEIVSGGFWEFHELQNEYLKLVTKSDVIMYYKNKAAGVDLRVNMGRYITTINLRDFKLQVACFADNVLVSNYFHPHISTSGNVCWGNAAGTVNEQLPKGNFKDVLTILASILVNYNSDSPYQSLAEFQKESGQKGPPKDAPEPLSPELQAAVEAQQAVTSAPTADVLRESNDRVLGELRAMDEATMQPTLTPFIDGVGRIPVNAEVWQRTMSQYPGQPISLQHLHGTFTNSTPTVQAFTLPTDAEVEAEVERIRTDMARAVGVPQSALTDSLPMPGVPGYEDMRIVVGANGEPMLIDRDGNHTTVPVVPPLDERRVREGRRLVEGDYRQRGERYIPLNQAREMINAGEDLPPFGEVRTMFINGIERQVTVDAHGIARFVQSSDVIGTAAPTDQDPPF